MERTALVEIMGELKLFGMRASYDEIMGTAIKRQHEPPNACVRALHNGSTLHADRGSMFNAD